MLRQTAETTTRKLKRAENALLSWRNSRPSGAPSFARISRSTTTKQRRLNDGTQRKARRVYRFFFFVSTFSSFLASGRRVGVFYIFRFHCLYCVRSRFPWLPYLFLLSTAFHRSEHRSIAESAYSSTTCNSTGYPWRSHVLGGSRLSWCICDRDIWYLHPQGSSRWDNRRFCTEL